MEEEGLMSFPEILIDHFKPVYQIAICYIHYNGKILLLKRHHSSSSGNRWCAPGGKLENGETPLQTVIREVSEETAIQLNAKQLDFVQTIYIRVPQRKAEKDSILHLFKATLPKNPLTEYTVVLNKEHTDYLWINPQECNMLNMIVGGKALLQLL
ncbi:NUDIX hydrolase [Cardinium endosymbiont of Tipula unca]|uniref:NUDIX hydrolase n=1 Tax=Cardinium endosymbiont of Tipula unca TaxID=3066216 RepID=UPI0030D0D072